MPSKGAQLPFFFKVIKLAFLLTENNIFANASSLLNISYSKLDLEKKSILFENIYKSLSYKILT